MAQSSGPPYNSWNYQTSAGSGTHHQGAINNDFQHIGSNAHFLPPPNNFSRPPPPINPVNKMTQSGSFFPQAPPLKMAPLPLPPLNFNHPPPSFNRNRLPPPITMNRPLPPFGMNSHHPSSISSLSTMPFNVPQSHQDFTPSSDHYLAVHPCNQHQSQIPSIHNMSHSNKRIKIPSVPNHDQSSVAFSEFLCHDETSMETLPESLESEMGKKRKEGQQLLTSWMKKIGKTKKKVSSELKRDQKTSAMKINDYLCKLQTSSEFLKKMSSQIEKLSSMLSETDRSSWQKECNITEAMKAEHKISEKYFERKTTEQVKNRLTVLKLKRKRLKKRRHHKYLQSQQAEEDRQGREKEISEWQQRLCLEMKEELLKKKRKAEMDQTLSSVTKKIHDANRLIYTMTALEKLRLIRQDAAKKRGDTDVGESRHSFEQKISDMTRLIQSQLEVYKEEEQQLRNNIKSEQDETSEKERQIQLKKDKEEEIQKNKELQKMLFGTTEDASILDPIFPFQQFYKQAETNLQTFIQIRHEWDQFVVSGDHPVGSSIPTTWVTPDDPSSTSWASALK